MSGTIPISDAGRASSNSDTRRLKYDYDGAAIRRFGAANEIAK
jgi:hypothetical protein